jgi:hypothetical protein
MDPVDMDKIGTWPNEITAFLTAHSKDLLAERAADRNYTLAPSDFRILNGSPPMPRWKEATALIENVMADRELLAFHATRLIESNEVQREGLLRLDLARHVARIKGQLEVAGAFDELAQIDAAVKKMLKADNSFINREGAVWATPNRASLHDGGCNVFFESYGGEAIKRVAGYAQGKLEQRLKLLGKPAVVIIRYPAYGWCEFTHRSLPQSMIKSYLRQESDWETMTCGWDIMIRRDVPPQNIVAVLPGEDVALRVDVSTI